MFGGSLLGSDNRERERAYIIALPQDLNTSLGMATPHMHSRLCKKPIKHVRREDEEGELAVLGAGWKTVCLQVLTQSPREHTIEQG